MVKLVKSEKWSIVSILMTLLLVFVGGGALMAEAAVAVSTGAGPSATPGNAGLSTQEGGSPVTVSAAAEATGGVEGGNLIQPDIDDQIFMIGTDETVLDGIMRKAKRKLKVKGFEVDHALIDERKAYTETSSAYTVPATPEEQAELNVPVADRNLFSNYDTVIARGVNGYTENGQTAIPGSDLMLFVVGKNASSKKPIVIALNGPKTNATDEICTVPAIPAGTKLIFLANACTETQKYVAPNMITPVFERVYLQKTILNELISDYFDAQKKRIPFSRAVQAEAAVKEWRRKNNRTLWISHKAKFKVDRGDMGIQYDYTTEGVRWQFKKQFDHTGAWTFADIIALAKFKFTGQNTSKDAWWLMGKNLLEQIQNIDFTKHKDISMTATEKWGFACTQLHTVFGDFYLKHEPTLDCIDYANSGGILDFEGLVRYWMKNEEASTEKVEGEEAQRKCVISINALALKGTSHIWVNGEGSNVDLKGVIRIKLHNNATTAPVSPSVNDVFILKVACAAISGSIAGEAYQWNGTSWVKYVGTIYSESA